MTSVRGDNPKDVIPIFDLNGMDMDNGVEAKMDLDAIFDYVMKKHKAKTGEILNDGWEDENEEN